MKKKCYRILLLINLILLTLTANSQYQIPDYAQNYDPDQVTVYSYDIWGGAHNVADLTARDNIASAKRAIGMLVTYNDGVDWITERFEGVNTLDINWQNQANWSTIGGAVADSSWQTATAERLNVDTVSANDNTSILFIDPIKLDTILFNDTEMVDNGSGLTIKNVNYPDSAMLILNGSSAALSGYSTSLSGTFVSFASTDSAFIINGSTLYGDGSFGSTHNTAKLDNTTSNSQTMGGTTVTGFIDSKTIINNTPINLLNFEDTTIVSQTDGQLAYGEVSRTLDWVNNITGTTLQVGEEFRHPVWNATGVTIPNGRAVRRTGSHTNGRRVPTVDLAGIGSVDSSEVYGVTTVDILPGTFSYVIKHGDVNGLVTTDLDEDKAYLGFAGFMIDTMPDPPYPTIELGEVIYSDNDSGIVDIGIVDRGFSKVPTLSANFYDSAITVDILTQNVYQQITNVWNDAFNVIDKVGTNYVGDSIQVLVSGQWNIAFSTSFEGTTSSDTWKEGVFINNVLQYNTERYTASDATGNISGIVGLNLNANDWVSFRMVNTTSTRDIIVKNKSISLIFLHE